MTNLTIRSTIRSTISGTYTLQQLYSLKIGRIAWSGATSAEERNAQEAELSAMVEEAIDALAEWPDCDSVEIRGGEIVATVDTNE